MIESHKEILKKLERLEKKDIELDEKVTLIFEYLKELERQNRRKLNLNNANGSGLKIINSN